MGLPAGDDLLLVDVLLGNPPLSGVVDHQEPALGRSELTLAQFNDEIAQLRPAHAADASKLALLDRLQAWGDGIASGLR